MSGQGGVVSQGSFSNMSLTKNERLFACLRVITKETPDMMQSAMRASSAWVMSALIYNGGSIISEAVIVAAYPRGPTNDTSGKVQVACQRMLTNKVIIHQINY